MTGGVNSVVYFTHNRRRLIEGKEGKLLIEKNHYLLYYASDNDHSTAK